MQILFLFLAFLPLTNAIKCAQQQSGILLGVVLQSPEESCESDKWCRKQTIVTNGNGRMVSL